jgi:hypothetical protein
MNRPLLEAQLEDLTCPNRLFNCDVAKSFTQLNPYESLMLCPKLFISLLTD